MSDTVFLPEGSLIHTEQNLKNTATLSALQNARENEIIIEGEVLLCDSSHNLTVDLNGYTGVIPRTEAALGIEEGTTRDIAVISRVGKPVACIIRGIEGDGGRISLFLSRVAAQKKALRHLMTEHSAGDIVPARITHLEPFGAFVDIGCGNISLIGIEAISVSRISHPCNRFRVGDEIFSVITGMDFDKSRTFLSHRELLGTWEENAARFDVGQTVRGIVRGIEDYGIFIELSPNLSGLAEFRPDIKTGDCVSVFIKSILPDKMKIKLIIIDVFREKTERLITPSDYFITSGHIDAWRYSPEKCTKKEIVSVFR